MIENLAAHPYFHLLFVGALVLILAVLWGVRFLQSRKRRTYVLSAMREDDATASEPGVHVTLDSAPARAVPLQEVETALRLSLERGEEAKLPGIYLTLARHSLASHDPLRARDFLLQCVRTARMTHQSDIHARARFHLGEIAQAEGDLTTACEHWQIARKLFHEAELMDEHAAAEKRMLENGCPTDWVLTDF